jgi:uncharacterized membrane protein
MYAKLHEIFADKVGGEVFTCFGIYHFVYLAIFFSVLFFLIFYLRNKEKSVQKKAVRTVITIAFCFYMADFFLMPFAYGEIDIDKLPFHACTLMCIMGFWSRYNKFLSKYTLQFTLIGLISNMIYVVCPMGVASCAIHPLSYRAVQTLGFHGIMVIYSILALIYDDFKLELKKCYRELALLCIMAAWATIGNTLYSGSAGDYSHDFNWFFVESDPFGMLPQSISPYVMPFVTVITFFLANIFIYAVCFGIKKLNKKDK